MGSCYSGDDYGKDQIIQVLENPRLNYVTYFAPVTLGNSFDATRTIIFPTLPHGRASTSTPLSLTGQEKASIQSPSETLLRRFTVGVSSHGNEDGHQDGERDYNQGC